MRRRSAFFASLGRHSVALTMVCSACHCAPTHSSSSETAHARGSKAPAHESKPTAQAPAAGLTPDQLEERLRECGGRTLRKTRFSIAHRGAPAHFPEHTRESYEAAARMGAGLVECDVTFTKDGVGVCRHADCDLHVSTNILITDLADHCRKPFTGASENPVGRPASAECCVSDLTAVEFKNLCGRSPSVNRSAISVEQYLSSENGSLSIEDPSCGTLLTHAESITLLDSLGVDFVPELKRTRVSSAVSQAEIRRRALEFLEAYQRANIAPERVFPQSFDLDTISLWTRENPAYSKRSIFLDAQYESTEFDPNAPSTFSPSMADIRRSGAAFVGPPFWTLLVERDGRIFPTAYAQQARLHGLGIVPWSLSRPSLLTANATRMRPPFSSLLQGDDDYDFIIHHLAQDAHVSGLFSDDPARVTRYANCFDRDGPPRK